jgi:hypothetical protein
VAQRDHPLAAAPPHRLFELLGEERRGARLVGLRVLRERGEELDVQELVGVTSGHTEVGRRGRADHQLGVDEDGGGGKALEDRIALTTRQGMG